MSSLPKPSAAETARSLRYLSELSEREPVRVLRPYPGEPPRPPECSIDGRCRRERAK